MSGSEKKTRHLWLVGYPIHISDGFETEQSSTPNIPFQPLAACGRSSPDTAANPANPPVAPPVGDTGAAPVPTGGTSQARSSLLGAPGGFLRDAAAGWCHWEEGFCCSLVSIVLLIRPFGGYLGGGWQLF